MDDTWNRRFYFLFLFLIVWKFFYLYITPLDLVPDEAYYWDWSRQLDWGYYSKPPMVAWINGLSTGLLGVSSFTVRLPAALLSSVALWGIFLLSRCMFDSRTAFWAVAASAAAPGHCALGLIMTIDAPLVACWSLALYLLWLAMQQSHNVTPADEERNDGSLKYWLACGCIVCLGILSKQMMLVFLPLTVLFLLLSSGFRFCLRRSGLYLMLLVALVSFLPIIWWNMQHDWITFSHTAHHFEGNTNILKCIKTVGDFIGGQLLLVSPLTWILFMVVAVRLAARFFKQSDKVKFLLLFSITGIATITLLSFRQRIQANWPAVYYVGASILVAAWACGHISCGNSLDKKRTLFFKGVYCGAGLAFLTYIIPLALPLFGLDGGKLDPTARLRGWRELGKEINLVLEKLPNHNTTFLLATQRQVASELAFYVPGQPRVYQWSQEEHRPDSQYDIWPGPIDKIGWDCLFVFNAPVPQQLRNAFDRVQTLDTINVPVGNGASRKYSLYLGENLQKWPD